jgi:hypothetical protein
MTVDDLAQGAVKWLSAIHAVTDLLTAYPDGTPWLFQQDLWQDLEGTGGTAAVIVVDSGWAAPNTYNTMRFPRLQLDLYADPIRDPARNITQPGETRRRLARLFDVFDQRLHQPAGREQFWGDIRVIGSIRLGEPSTVAVPEGDGLTRLQVFYAITQA